MQATGDDRDDREDARRRLLREVPDLAGHVEGGGGQDVGRRGVEGAEGHLLPMALAAGMSWQADGFHLFFSA